MLFSCMVNFQKIEKKWQKKWGEEKIFEVNPNKKQKFFATVPYPYTSGPSHIGHGRTYTIADIFVRYQRMRGNNILWPMAFHVSGTPVLAISKKMKKNEKETINQFKSYVKLHTENKKDVEKIVKSFENPESIMKYFSKTYIQDFNSIGCSIDWRRKFTTNDSEYNKFIEWQFQKLKNSNLIKKGEYPILYCKSCKNAVGEDDIKSGDTIKPKVEEWNLWKFPFENSFIVCATLRPETIYGVTNIWINPKGKYVEATVNEENWIISKNSLEKLKFQDKNVEIKKEFFGEELIGKKVNVPIEKRSIPILKADFVSVDNGTGIVYSVPAHAPYDYVALKESKEDIKPISIINIENYSKFPAKDVVEKYKIKNQKEDEKLKKATEEIYKNEFYQGILNDRCKKFKGKKVSEIKEGLVKIFEKEKKLDKMYEVSAIQEPVLCRCGGEVIVSVLKDQWFIDYGNKRWKEKTKKCLKNMEIFPETYRKFFDDTIEWVHERPAARKRGLGTKLPFDKDWIIESLSDSTIYMAFYTIIHHIKDNNIPTEKLNFEFWDYVLLGKGNINDLDIDKKIVKKMKDEFEYWYPVDLRHTAIAHITNHLIFYIFNHTAIFDKKYWPKRITLNELLIREGKKMSKSLGNVIPLAEIPKKYFADLFRLYVSYAADLSTVLNWNENEVMSLNNKISKFYNLVSNSKSKKYKNTNATKWLISKFNRVIENTTKAIENYSIREYIQSSFYDVINDINYFKRRAPSEIGVLKEEIYPKWIKILAPVIPHISEELWGKMGNNNFVSIESWPKPNKNKIDEKAEEGEEYLKSVHSDINQIIKLVGKTPVEIEIFVADNWKYEMQDILNKNKDKKSKDLIPILMKNKNIKNHGKTAINIMQKLLNSKTNKLKYLGLKEEIKVLKEASDFLKNEFNCKIKILNESESDNKKSRQAMPGKPAILVK